MTNEAPQRPVALVTGGSRGIGRAVCETLAKQGFDVAVNYAGNEEQAKATVTSCEEAGAKSFAICANVADEQQVKDMVAQVVETFGQIDVLVNNAGITLDGLTMRMSTKNFDDVISVNLRGSFLCAKEVIRPMIKRRSGRIINMSSVVGIHGNAGQVNYSASKAGVIGMTKSLAAEVGSRGITVNAIAPGFIQTDMTAALPEKAVDGIKGQIPLGCFGEAQDVADAVAFLASPQARYITGQVLGVDGGMGM